MRNKIDLQYRPRSYFWAEDLGVQLSSHIKGAERKALYEYLLAEGRADEIDSLLTKSELTPDERQGLGRFHPSFMGGEYLPNRKGGEVEIARITIASTTQDVTSVYARRGKKRINYRVVDEYEGGSLAEKTTCSSALPMTLGQLTDFFLKTWDLIEVLHYNFEGEGYSSDEIKGFVVDASSSFYADFGKAIDARIDKWLASRGKGVTI
jgi:hypothetical protein